MFGVWETAGNGTKPFLPSTKDLLTPHRSTISLMQCTFQALIVSQSLYSGITMQNVIRLWLLAQSPACSYRPLTVWHGLLLRGFWVTAQLANFFLRASGCIQKKFWWEKKRTPKFKPKKISRTGLAWEGQTHEAIMTWEPEVCPLLLGSNPN